jgi:hypothetical protein
MGAKCSGGSCFPESGETFCHFIMRNNVFVGSCCPDKDDNRSCTRRFSALFLPFLFMYWLAIVEDISTWTENDGWHMTLYSMLILAGQLLCLVIGIKIYQCLIVDCCATDDAHKHRDEAANLVNTIWMALTNMEIFATLGMLIACVIATFHIWGQTSEEDGTTYVHGELLKSRLMKQFLPVFLLYVFGLDFLLNACIFCIGKCCTCGGTSGGGGTEKQPLNPDGQVGATAFVGEKQEVTP